MNTRMSHDLNTVGFSPLLASDGDQCGFGVLVKPACPSLRIDALSISWLKDLLRDHQLVVLRGFGGFDSAGSMEDYCATFGSIMMWPFGAVLDVLEHPDPDDHIFANSYVPLHWDGMYLATVPEFQIFHGVRSIGDARGGRTTFSSTTEALQVASPEVRELWRGVRGSYQRSVELYSNTVQAPIIDTHPYRHYPVLRFCEPPVDGDSAFINPSVYEFDGIPATERQVLLDTLRAALYHPRAHYAHRWEAGDVVLADNFTLLHGREAFERQSGRHIRRVHIHGEPELRNPHIARSHERNDVPSGPRAGAQ